MNLKQKHITTLKKLSPSDWRRFNTIISDKRNQFFTMEKSRMRTKSGEQKVEAKNIK